MRLKEFIDYNKSCPICGNELRLYMQWTYSYAFEGQILEDGSLYFSPMVEIFKGKDAADEYCLLELDNNGIANYVFSNTELKSEAERHQIYFFFLCNPAGFRIKNTDYDINLYKGCYYRSTPLFEIREKERFVNIFLDSNNIINKDEAFSFKRKTKEIEKVYMLNFDYEDKNTTLWYFTITSEEKLMKDFKPKLFHKKLPLLSMKLKTSLEDREKLFDKLDSWIIMS